MLACVKFKKPFVIDGFITAVAAACAVHMNERITDYALPSHHSREKRHRASFSRGRYYTRHGSYSSPHVDGGRDRSYLNGSNAQNYTAYVCKRRDLCRFDEIIRRTNENK